MTWTGIKSRMRKTVKQLFDEVGERKSSAR